MASEAAGTFIGSTVCAPWGDCASVSVPVLESTKSAGALPVLGPVTTNIPLPHVASASEAPHEARLVLQRKPQNALFSIGAHSMHHSMLAEQNVNDQAFEVRESKRQIETWLGKPVKGFAYPYGNYNAVTQTLLREAGFEYAVSTEQKLVTAKDDRFALPRIQIKNWCVYEFASKMNEMVN